MTFISQAFTISSALLLSMFLASCATAPSQEEISNNSPIKASVEKTDQSKTEISKQNTNQPSLPSGLENIRIGEIKVVQAERLDPFSTKGPELQNIVDATQAALSEKLAGLSGEQVVNLNIIVTQYYVGRLGSPTFRTKVQPIDASTGQPLAKEKVNVITQIHFDGGGLFFDSPYATPFDKKFPAMVGLYARKFPKRLAKSLGIDEADEQAVF